MKALKFVVLILTILIINSCKDKDEVEEESIYCCTPYYQHMLLLSFQDELGNDLLDVSELVLNKEVSGETKPELYIYNLNADHRLYYKALKLLSNSDYYYLSCSVLIDLGTKFSENIIFRHKDLSLFGDNKEHDIVTWWKPKDDTEQGAQFPICYRVEYGGKEFSVEKFSNVNIATIILDR